MLIDCNCIEDLGCFVPDPNVEPGDDTIKFDLVCICPGEFTFFVHALGGIQVITKTFALDDPIELENTFNETAEIFIKIKAPEGCAPENSGFNFLTSTGGACVWKVKNTGSAC